jgi:hypothetical protein
MLSVGLLFAFLQETEHGSGLFPLLQTEGALIDRSGTTVSDLAEACDHATLVVQSLIMAPSQED